MLTVYRLLFFVRWELKTFRVKIRDRLEVLPKDSPRNEKLECNVWLQNFLAESQVNPDSRISLWEPNLSLKLSHALHSSLLVFAAYLLQFPAFPICRFFSWEG